MEQVFKFKKFQVRNSDSALKVGTDAVLLGAAMTLLPSDRRLLDIGTGTGVIALMAAQRLNGLSPEPSCFRITGIDIDGASAAEASLSFAESPWPATLEARHCSLRDFEAEECCPRDFDLIFSNPPYYDNSLVNPDAREGAARHTGSLSYREVLAFASEHLAPGGRVAMILPSESEKTLLRTAASFGLRATRLLRIRTTAAKPPRRLLSEFSTDPAVSCLEEVLTLQQGTSRTPEYSSLVSDFYL